MCMLYFLGYYVRYVRKVVFHVCCILFVNLFRYVRTVVFCVFLLFIFFFLFPW